MSTIAPTSKPRQRRSTLPARTSSPSSFPESCGSCMSTDSSAALSPSFQCLENISLDVTVEEEQHASKPGKTAAVFYVLHVRHTTCDVAWSHRRSLTEYVAFQTQLLHILEQGHACSGDCPWLYSFLKSYFPRASSCRIKALCPRRIAKHRESLALCLATLRSFLLTRENQSCTVLRRSVLKAVTGFVYGELGPNHPLLRKVKVSDDDDDDDDGVAESPVSSRASTTESDSSSVGALDLDSPQSSARSSASGGAGRTNAVPTCALCRSRLDEEAAAFSIPTDALSLPASTVSSASSTSSSSTSTSTSGRYYATKLRCGHEFHDECILVWLNQALSCPLCGQHELSP